MVEENISNSILKKTVNIFDKKLDFFTNNSLVSLIIIGVIGLSIRLFYFPFDIPLTSDALTGYFFYATDTSILGHLPTDFTIANNGWPVFLSFFFSIFRFDNTYDYMILQREITISLSILTIIPVYFLCRRFFDKPYALVGAAIFALEPRIIQNSLLGLSESLYIVMISITLCLFFSSNRKITYISFVIIALTSIVRSEGLFLFFPLLIIFFLRNQKEKNVILKTMFATGIFISIILPMAIFRIQVQGSDLLTGRIVSATNRVLTSAHETGFNEYVILAIENIVKLSGWSLIPIFIFFMPIGIFLILKNRNHQGIMLILVTIFMLLPIFYAFSVAQDTRYIYPLFPLFCVFSLFTIKRIIGKKETRNTFLILIIVGVLFASVSFLDIKKFDYDHQKEAFGIAQQVIITAKGINDYYPEDVYIRPAEIPTKWPTLKSDIPSFVSIIQTKDFDSLEQYIKSSKNYGMTHLVVDDSKNRTIFLNDVFNHEEKYSYLIKTFDSQENGYKYHVKIFKIDYGKFELR